MNSSGSARNGTVLLESLLHITQPAMKHYPATDGNLSESLNSSLLNSTLKAHEIHLNFSPSVETSQASAQIVLVAIASTLLSMAIIACNCLVFLSFKINKKLHTISNFFILSLAASDLLVGIFSTNLYTMYLLLGYWPMGTFICDAWLSIDYVCRQASVFNLVVICVDRYMNLKRPFLHKVNRTAFKARIVISIVWIASLLTWAPLIVSYQFIVGERTVGNKKCHVQFLSDSIPITIITGLLTFYVPVAIMVILYFKIYRLTTDRIRDFALMTLKFHIGSTADFLSEEQKRQKKRSSFEDRERRKKSVDLRMVRQAGLDKFIPDDDTMSIQGQEKPSTAQPNPTPQRKHAIVIKREPSGESLLSKRRPSAMSTLESPTAPRFLRKKSSSFDYSGLQSQQGESLLSRVRSNSGTGKELGPPIPRVRKKSSSVDFTGIRILYQKESGKRAGSIVFDRPRSDSLFGRRDTLFSRRNTMLRRRGSVGKHRKAAKMVILLLLAFILTWILYNLLSLVQPFCIDCIPTYLWNVSNWLCYINSLINPFCYAFGNKEFRNSFRILVGLGRQKINKKFRF